MSHKRKQERHENGRVREKPSFWAALRKICLYIFFVLGNHRRQRQRGGLGGLEVIS